MGGVRFLGCSLFVYFLGGFCSFLGFLSFRWIFGFSPKMGCVEFGSVEWKRRCELGLTLRGIDWIVKGE